MWHYNVFIIKYIKIIIARLSFHDRHNVNKPVSSSIVVTILHRMAQLSPGGCIKCKHCRLTLMAQLSRGRDGRYHLHNGPVPTSLFLLIQLLAS